MLRLAVLCAGASKAAVFVRVWAAPLQWAYALLEFLALDLAFRGHKGAVRVF